ncbi:hypothetical protein QE357_002725 [Siphonobacter sp. BAB-5404]|nr:hypothetical protein [Siphonobacter sp. SORGH_AS_0500]
MVMLHIASALAQALFASAVMAYMMKTDPNVFEE